MQMCTYKLVKLHHIIASWIDLVNYIILCDIEERDVKILENSTFQNSWGYFHPLK